MTSLLIKRKEIDDDELRPDDVRPPTTRRRLVVTTATNVKSASLSSSTTSTSTSTSLRDFQTILKHEKVREFLEQSIWVDPYLIAVTYQYMLRIKSTMQWNLKSFCLALTLGGIFCFVRSFDQNSICCSKLIECLI